MADGDEPWFCYMVRCNDGSLYVGIARDVAERVKRHNWGVGPGFTAKRRPVGLVWSERCDGSKVARAREKEIKGWSRSRKLALIEKNGEGQPVALRMGRVNPSSLRTAGKPFKPANGGFSG
ncbi:MAG TPA: GIY-YIG nuclease family protein [Verrucomicrobiae bacterium]|nr:GIY-YIG nuclease family protein [Verrucomicrobiae bacterium]